MEKRKAVWYSIIRYSPDNLSGEIINVGLLMHYDAEVKFLMLSSNSNKLKSIVSSKTGINKYKSYKDTLEYYLNENKDDLSGLVGGIKISSYYNPDFLKDLAEYYRGEKMYLTEPNFAFTENIDALFNNLFTTYIGEQYLNIESTTVTAKKIVKNYFEEKQLIGRKVRYDVTVQPIEDLDSLQLKVDFSFKNGVHNYLQAIPNLNRPSQNSEWFAKMKLMIEYLNKDDSKIHLLYRHSDFEKNRDLPSFIEYLVNSQNVLKLNIDDKNKVTKLCDYIESEAEELENYVAG